MTLEIKDTDDLTIDCDSIVFVVPVRFEKQVSFRMDEETRKSVAKYEEKDIDEVSHYMGIVKAPE